MSVIEGKYRLKPQGRAKLWSIIVGVSAVLLLLPTVINSLIPNKGGDYKQLEVGLMGLDWTLPIVTAEGAPVMCEETSDEITSKYWNCNGDTTVVTMVVEGVEDPSNTLRRMVFSSLVEKVDPSIEAVASEDGTAHALYVPGSQHGDLWTLPIVALSQQGTGDYEDFTAITIINGEYLEYYGSHVWSSMAIQRGEPYEQEIPFELEDTPNFELPFDLNGDLEGDLDSFLEQHPDLFNPSILEGESL